MANTKKPHKGPYSPHYTDDEIDRIISAFYGAEPAAGLDAITEATYVLLDRIIARLSSQAEPSDATDELGMSPEAFVKLVRAHNETTGRLAQLARTRRVISGTAGEALADNIAAALDQLAEMFDQTL